MWLWTIIGAILIGLLIGPLARLVMPGKQNISVGMTIVLGFVAALLGGWIAQLLGVGDTDGIDWIKLLIQVVVAAIFIGIYGSMRGRSTT